MGTAQATDDVRTFRKENKIMFDLKITIIYATLVCVSADVKNTTLELRGNAVYDQLFELLCFTKVNTSTPYAIFYRNLDPPLLNNLAATVLYNTSSNECDAKKSSFTNYTYSCSNEGKNITLTVPAENEVEHDTLWQCINEGSPQEPNNNIVKIFVNYPVQNVTVRNNTLVTVIEGISGTFICETSPCRPSADIYWMKNGNNISDPQRNSIHQSGTKNVTTSSLQFTAVRRDNGSLLACGAYNGYGTRKLSVNIIIIVHYSPIVNNFTSPVKVVQGNKLEVVCSADGNPAPRLVWNPVGDETVNSSRLYYSAISKNNAVKHTCTATNNMVHTTGSPQQGTDSKELVIDVLYSPTVKNFTSPVKVIQGQPLEVECSGDGNPPPQLTWNPLGEDSVNKSRLYYSAISRDKAVIHTCTATNNMVPTTGSPHIGSDSKELLVDVLYSPIVNPITLPEVIEGQPLGVVCIADGNPPPELTWDPVGDDNNNKSKLFYSAISRSKAVVHRCTATNKMMPTIGQSQQASNFIDILIDVLYNASVSMFTAKDNISVLNENSSIQLLCQVDSNPYSAISLYFENNLKLRVENAQNLSYTKTAGCLDAGKYTCTARNKIMNGDAVSRELQINVTCCPRLADRANVSKKHYGSLGDNVTLEVYVIAYPEPTDITWYHREKETDMWQMFSFQSPSSSGLHSIINIHLASQTDFGYYKVNMSNDFGNFSNTYSVIPASKPGIPSNFSVAVNGPDFVTLEWTPGFWGGHLQHFIIQYRIFPDGAWVKLDRIVDNGLAKQTVTITGLQQKTTYKFILYAANLKGSSDNTSASTTTTEMHGNAFPVRAVAGSISGALVASVICILIFLRLRRQRRQRGDDGSSTELKEKERPESGLVDNPVYDSSDPKSSQSTSSGAAGTEYAVVVKKKAVLIENSSDMYAQVHKQKEKMENGDMYEDADIGRSPGKENIYSNSNSIMTEPSGDNVYENPGATASHNLMVNKDGILYVDLMLDPPTTKNGMPFIRGMENRTEYAEIAFGKRGDPLPDSDEEKEMNKRRVNN